MSNAFSLALRYGTCYNWAKKQRRQTMRNTGIKSANHKQILEGDVVKDDTNIAVVRFGKYRANNNLSYSNEVAYGFYLEFTSHKGVIDHATNLEYYDVIQSAVKGGN